jgi:hypothetical protein
VGAILTVKPTALGNGSLSYSVDYQYSDFNGFAETPPARAATYTTHKGFGLGGTNAIGETVLVDLTSRDEKALRRAELFQSLSLSPSQFRGARTNQKRWLIHWDPPSFPFRDFTASRNLIDPGKL